MASSPFSSLPRVRFALCPRVTCMLEARAPRCSTGYLPATTAAHSSCVLKTPISNAPPQRWLKAFFKACAGLASIGMKVLTIRRSAWSSTGRMPRNSSPPDTPTIVFVRRRNWNHAARPQRLKGVPRATTVPAAKYLAKRAPVAGLPERAAAVRFAVPESGSTFFNDAVFGRVEFANTELEDFGFSVPTEVLRTT